MNSLTALLVLLSSTVSFGQGWLPPQSIAQSTQLGNVSAQPGNDQALTFHSLTTYVGRSNGKLVNGSPYMDSRWLVAHLTTTRKAQIPPLPLRYDVLNKRLVMQSSDAVHDSLQLNDNDLVQFELEDPATSNQSARKRVFRRFYESSLPKQMTDYVEVLHEGKISLLKHYEKQYVESAANNGLTTSSDYIKDKVTYYVSRAGSVPMPVKLTLKSLQLMLPEFASTLKSTPGAQDARTDMQWTAVLDAVDPK
jgi:hypothetical protein